jgi:dsDNA-specific endonuclease/ATPase MutS2
MANDEFRMEEKPFEVEITDTLDLHAFHPGDLKVLVEEYLHQCRQKGLRFVRIIHGKGTGLQRDRVLKILKASPHVETFEDGPDWGSTVVTLRP